MRSRELIGLPVGESSMALMPEPPMSMESVTGEDAVRLATFGVGVAVETAFDLIGMHFTE